MLVATDSETQLIRSTVQSSCWEANNRLASQEFPTFYGSQSFTTISTGSSAKPAESCLELHTLLLNVSYMCRPMASVRVILKMHALKCFCAFEIW
jgi:hypothetical protein